MIKRLVALALLALVGLAGLVVALNFRDEGASDAAADAAVATRSPAASIARGEYLTRPPSPPSTRPASSTGNPGT